MEHRLPVIAEYCNFVLPAVYDDSLSYYEVLAKVVDKLNAIGETVNILIDSLGELMEEYGEVYDELQTLKSTLGGEHK